MANLIDEMVKGPTFSNIFAILFATPVAAPHIHASIKATNG